MPTRIISPHRFEPFVDEDGRPHRIPQDWIESISRAGNAINDLVIQNNSSLSSRVIQNEADISDIQGAIPHILGQISAIYGTASDGEGRIGDLENLIASLLSELARSRSEIGEFEMKQEDNLNLLFTV